MVNLGFLGECEYQLGTPNKLGEGKKDIWDMETTHIGPK